MNVEQEDLLEPGEALGLDAKSLEFINTLARGACQNVLDCEMSLGAGEPRKVQRVVDRSLYSGAQICQARFMRPADLIQLAEQVHVVEMRKFGALGHDSMEYQKTKV